jgi:hypothetical protein
MPWRDADVAVLPAAAIAREVRTVEKSQVCGVALERHDDDASALESPKVVMREVIVQ